MMPRRGREAMMRLTLVLAAWLGLLAADGAAGAELRGTLSLYAEGRALRAAEAAEAVIWFRPKRPVAMVPPAEPVVMLTRRKQFQPRVLAVPAGGAVRFPNEDPILHNVFSTSPDNAFDAGLYGTGSGVVHAFRNPGLVKVYCNVHHSMFGFIVVLDTPFHTRAGVDGRFRLQDLPAGEGELVVFHDRARPWRRAVDPAGAGAVDIRLDLDRRRVPPHMNKFGRPYGARPDDRTY
jgi:plastocyanin